MLYATCLRRLMLVSDVSRWHFAIEPRFAWWQVLLAGGLLVLLAVTVYWREPLAASRKRLLMALRSASLVLLVWMLWGWMIASEELKLPQLWLLVDQSASMQLAGESTRLSRAEQVSKRLQSGGVLNSLSDRFEVRIFGMGNGIQEKSREQLFGGSQAFKESTSRLGEDLSSLLASTTGQPVSAIWILSDGRVTEGRALTDSIIADQEDVPVYVTPLGDQTPPLDIVLRDVRAPVTAIPGDEIEIQATLTFPSMQVEEIQVELLDEQATVLTRQSMDVADALQEGGLSRATLPLRTTLGRSGIHTFRVRVNPINGETNTDNNEMPLQVEVREEPLRVLLIAGTPNYEFRFFKHLLERSTGPDQNKPWLTLTSVLQEGDPRYADQDRSAVRLPPVEETALDAFDVVVLIDANPDGLGPLLLERIAERIDRRGTGLLIVGGPKHLPHGLRGTPLAEMLPIVIEPTKPTLPTMLGKWRLRLTPFGAVERSLQLPDQAWEQMPAVQLMIPYKQTAVAAQVLVDGVNEQGEVLPAIITQRFGSGRIQLHLTDEMFRLVSTGTSDVPHEQFWLQSIRRLARGRQEARADYVQLRARPARAEAHEPVNLDLSLSDELGAKLAGDVRVKLSEPSRGLEQTITLSPDLNDDNHWQHVLEQLPSGKWEAELMVPGTRARVGFEVQAAPTETMRTDGDRPALESVAKLTHGKVIEMTATTEDVLNRLPKSKPISRRAGETRPLWNHPFLVLLLCTLLISEWGLRRWWNLL